jgi:hypothetical protein
MSAHKSLPVDPELRVRRYIDGLVAIPLDLLRDPTVSASGKGVACALDSLCLSGSAEVHATNGEIGRECVTSAVQVGRHLVALEESGWIVRAAGPDPGSPRGQRRIVLLWKLPDDWSGLIPAGRVPRKPRASRVVPPPPQPPTLFPPAEGGDE